MLMMNFPNVVNHDIQPIRNKTLNAVTSDTMQALQKLLTEVTTKTAKMINLLKMINYDTKVVLRRITLAAQFHSKQVFPAPKQTKGVNIEDAQRTNLFHKNHWNQHGPSGIFYDIEQVHTTAKPQVNTE